MPREHCPVCGAHVSGMCIHVNRLVDAILHGVPDDDVSPPTESGDNG